MTAANPSFRQQVLEKMTAALGPPEVSSVASGDLYRWTLRRVYDVNLYVTMDSPEREDLAHIMLSDSLKHQDKPIVSSIIYTVPECDALIARILKQWKSGA